MNALILVAALTCPQTKVINISKLPWQQIDTQNLQQAKVRCGQKYADAPCLVQFVKVRDRVYRAICGAKR